MEQSFKPLISKIDDTLTPEERMQSPGRKEEVLKTILALSETDLCWVLHEVADERPRLKITFVDPGIHHSILHDHAPHVQRELVCRETPNDLRKDQSDVDLALSRNYAYLKETWNTRSSEYDQVVKTYVQFAMTEVFCTEDDKSVDVHVFRTGDKTLESTVDYYTESDMYGSMRFVPKVGTIVFAPGDPSAIVSIELMARTDVWEGLVEFKVCLVDDSTRNCELAHQLQYTRVKILDSSTFPTEKYKKQLEGGEADKIRSINWIGLLFDYFRWLLSSSYVRWNTGVTFFLDQVTNMTFLVHLWCQVYLLDYIVAMTREFQPLWILKDREMALLFVAALELANVALVHAIAWSKYNFGISGAQRQRLQQGIIKAFLNYDYDSAQHMSSGGLVLSVFTRDAVEAVNLYVSALALLQNAAEVLMLAVPIVLYPVCVGQALNPMLIYPFIIFPVGQALFIFCRSGTLDDALHKRQEAQDDILKLGNDFVSNHGIIRDYRLRQHFVNLSEEYIANVNRSMKNVSMLMLNNEKFMVWMTAALMAWWTLYGGESLLHESVSIGMFVGTYKAYHKLGHAFGEVYRIALDMKSTMPALGRVCVILNGLSDLRIRHENAKANERETVSRRHAAAKKFESPLNCLPIALHDLKFKVRPGLSNDGQKLFRGILEIEQGSLICLLGDEAGGKGTILRLIGGSFAPPILGGKLFIPTHLRVLNVMHEPLFFRGSIFYNLTVGCHSKRDADPARVQQVLGALSFSRQIDIHLEPSLPWKDLLSMTQCHKLTVARSLIANPHVLCMHKPALAFDYETSKVIMGLLRSYVEQRGVYLDEEQFHSRRPHTCIYTSSKQMTVAAADRVVRVMNHRIEILSEADRKAMQGRVFDSGLS